MNKTLLLDHEDCGPFCLSGRSLNWWMVHKPIRQNLTQCSETKKGTLPELSVSFNESCLCTYMGQITGTVINRPFSGQMLQLV